MRGVQEQQPVLRPPDSRHALSDPVPRRAASGARRQADGSAVIDDPRLGPSALADASNLVQNDRSLLMENLQPPVIIVENLDRNMELSLSEEL